MATYRIGKSLIHGKGILAKTPYAEGDIIGVALIPTIHGYIATENLGRYVNHNYHPNTEFVKKDLVYIMVATDTINTGEEIVANYNDAPDFVERAKEDYV